MTSKQDLVFIMTRSGLIFHAKNGHTHQNYLLQMRSGSFTKNTSIFPVVKSLLNTY